MNLMELNIDTTARLIRSGEISSLELTQAFLERIEAINPRINCFITVTAERALARARQADRELHRFRSDGVEEPGPLHGIPVAYKDLYETRGIRTTAGARFFQDYLPENDAFVVKRLEAAGAISLGKLNMHEIALGVTNVNPHFGPCRNPWSPDRITGGSSGGSAAALAAGLCLGSVGTDTGGSIRIPASLCGVVGLKPTYGRISLRGVIPLSWNLDHAGPMARQVRDVSLLYHLLTGYDPEYAYSIRAPQEAPGGALEGGVQHWQIALANDEYFDKVEPEVRQAVARAGQVFEQLGAQVTPVSFPGAREAALANGLMVTSDAAAFHRERLQTRPEQFGADIRQRLESGAAYTSTEYSLARDTQNRMRRQFEQFFERYTVLLTPTTPVAAPLIEGPDALEQARLLTRFTAPFNLTGLPAISLPCGFTSEGLPLGLQIITRPWGEANLLQAAYAYEQATGWHKQFSQL